MQLDCDITTSEIDNTSEPAPPPIITPPPITTWPIFILFRWTIASLSYAQFIASFLFFLLLSLTELNDVPFCIWNSKLVSNQKILQSRNKIIEIKFYYHFMKLWFLQTCAYCWISVRFDAWTYDIDKLSWSWSRIVIELIVVNKIMDINVIITFIWGSSILKFRIFVTYHLEYYKH